MESAEQHQVGQVFRALREGARLSRRELARRAQVEQSHLARFESGERDMSAEKLARALRALADHIGGVAA